MKIKSRYILFFIVTLFCFSLPMQVYSDTLKSTADVTSSKTITKQPESKATDNDAKPGRIHDSLLVLVVCLLYFCLMLLARYIWIIVPNNRHLLAYADKVEAQFKNEQEKPQKESELEKAVKTEILRLLTQVRNIIPDNPKWYCWLFAGTGKQLAGWRLAHEAKRLTTDVLDKGDVHAQAIVVTESLKELKKSEATELSNKISEILNSGNQDNIKPFLKRAQETIYETRDSYFETLADWQNKAMWLVMTAVLILLVLGITFGNATLFVLGALGGLLSRLRKVIAVKEVGFDYGVSWSTLFLAPIVGALTGWAGILLIVLLVDFEILGPVFSVFESLQWNEAATSQEAMALSIVFGFSATLFNRMMERIEGKLEEGPPSEGAKSNKQE